MVNSPKDDADTQEQPEVAAAKTVIKDSGNQEALIPAFKTIYAECSPEEIAKQIMISQAKHGTAFYVAFRGTPGNIRKEKGVAIAAALLKDGSRIIAGGILAIALFREKTEGTAALYEEVQRTLDTLERKKDEPVTTLITRMSDAVKARTGIDLPQPKLEETALPEPVEAKDAATPAVAEAPSKAPEKWEIWLKQVKDFPPQHRKQRLATAIRHLRSHQDQLQLVTAVWEEKLISQDDFFDWITTLSQTMRHLASVQLMATAHRELATVLRPPSPKVQQRTARLTGWHVKGAL